MTAALRLLSSELESVRATAVLALYLYVFELYPPVSHNLSVHISTYQYLSEFMLKTWRKSD